MHVELNIQARWISPSPFMVYLTQFYNKVLFSHHPTFLPQNWIFLPSIAWVSQESLNGIWDTGKEQVKKTGEDWVLNPVRISQHQCVLPCGKEWVGEAWTYSVCVVHRDHSWCMEIKTLHLHSFFQCMKFCRNLWPPKKRRVLWRKLLKDD